MNSSGEFSVFRLLIYAIVALMMVWIFFAYIVPALWPPQTTFDEISKAVNFSEGIDGKSYSKEIFYNKDFALDAEGALDTQIRSVTFQCLAADYCVDGSLSVDPRYFASNENQSLMTTFRCLYEKELYACRIYFGKTPAQLELKEIDFKQKFDLSSEKVSGSVSVENTGSLKAFNALLEAKAYKKRLVNGQWQKTLAKEVSQQFSLEESQSQEFPLELSLTESGLYELDLRVSADEAGYDTAVVEFEVTAPGITPGCTATTSETAPSLSIDGVQCEQKFYCTGCNYAFECRELWQGKGVDLSEPNAKLDFSDPDFAEKIFPPFANGTCVQMQPQCTAVSSGITALNATLNKCVQAISCSNCVSAGECRQKAESLGKTVEAVGIGLFEVKGDPNSQGTCEQQQSQAGFCQFSVEITTANNPISACNPYLDLLKQYSTQSGLTSRGIDILLVESIIKQESSCNPNINNQGLMQVVSCDSGGANYPCSLEKNIDLGTKELASNYENIVGKGISGSEAIQLILFSYNRGKAAANLAIEYRSQGQSLFDAMYSACEYFYIQNAPGSTCTHSNFDVYACCGKPGIAYGQQVSGYGYGAKYAEKILTENYQPACAAVGGTIG
ncbi:MAG: transglycosylase SLT domain-containing protein [Candidatus Diapherotrites archaeon]